MRKTKLTLIPAIALTALLLVSCASSGTLQTPAAAQTAAAQTTAAPASKESSAAKETTVTETTAAKTDADDAGSSGETAVVPDFSFEDELGTTLRLKDILSYGKPVVLNFWATWCSPCCAEMPHFEKAFAEHGEEIEFMMVDLTDGEQETVESSKKFIEDAGYTFPVYFDTRREGAKAYGIMSIPTTYFIYPDGTLAAWAQGSLSEETLAEGIRRLQK